MGRDDNPIRGRVYRNLPKQFRKIRDKGPKKGWVEGERTDEDGIFDEDPVSFIKGIGGAAAKVLARMGVKTVRQLARSRSSRIDRLVKKRGFTRPKVNAWIESAKQTNSGAFVANVIDHRREANPYLSRYGDEWKDHIRTDIRRSGSVCITELIHHMDDCTRAAYDGTEWEGNYYWYHDALSQLTCKRTKAYMIEKGLLKRWLLPVGPCNEGTVYFGRPVGNSPELMPWDCSLNADVHSTVEFYSTICKWLPKEHPLYPKRFSKASTKVMLDSYLRVLRIACTSRTIGHLSFPETRSQIGGDFVRYESRRCLYARFAVFVESSPGYWIDTSILHVQYSLDWGVESIVDELELLSTSCCS